MSINKIYESKVSNLISRINEIQNKGLDNFQTSNAIMEELRKEYILLPLEYINSLMYTKEQLCLFENTLLSLEWKDQKEKEAFINKRQFGKKILEKIFFQSEATIDPSKIADEEYQGDTVIIRGNSFGPFDSKKYFESPIKILWILKEPLITKGTWFSKYDRGGHNQAEENNSWENMEDNPTLENLIHTTQTLLHNLDDSNKTYTEQQAMDHICILEVNHFPGLAFNSWKSDDRIIKTWVALNFNLIKNLIEFYKPIIIIGGETFMGYFTPYYDMLNWYSDKENSDIPFRETGELKYYRYKDENGKEIKVDTIFLQKIVRAWGGENKHSMVKTSNGCYWINAYHPSNKGEKYKILTRNIEKFAYDIYHDLHSKQISIRKVGDYSVEDMAIQASPS